MTLDSKHRAPWSAEDIAELKAMVLQHRNRREIALALGRTEQAITARLCLLKADRSERSGQKRARHRRTNGAAFFLS